MDYNYTSEKNILQIIALLKAHNIKKIVVSPGSSNVSFVASVQQDDYFELYSVVDERSAAYVACGMAAEANEPIVICCTGATASRNYIPALTEAFYRKLPIVAITALVHPGYIGQNRAQVMDRTVLLKDIVRTSVQVDVIGNEDDEWANNVKINKALLELKKQGGGPVHINMVTTFSRDFSIKQLPNIRKIGLVQLGEKFPDINNKKIAIFIGAHRKMNDVLLKQIDLFCEKYNGVVFYDHTSNYQGKYGVLASLISSQDNYVPKCLKMDILIDIGDISGADIKLYPNEIWRVNPDGEIRDNRKLTKNVFEMNEEYFFKYYNDNLSDNEQCITYYNECIDERNRLLKKISDLPFSNLWLAWKLSSMMPANSVIHFAILNSLRSWNYFDYDSSILGFANTGGFGIDGCISSLLGASMVSPEKLFFGIVGDLAFFYDLNSLGIRNISCNVRILLINNGNGTEFRNYSCIASQFGEDTKRYISASGHNGAQSKKLVKDFAEDLGFKYITSDNKEDFLRLVPEFLNSQSEKSIIFEVFTDSKLESEALYRINNLEVSRSEYVKNKTKKTLRNVLGEEKTNIVKKLLK